jgi:predicted lysophospholipase L1 biosynthesis ABC-type transport system permease subunit
VYSKLALAGLEHRPARAALGAVLTAAGLIAVLLAVGLGHGPAAADSVGTVRQIAVLRPVFRRFAPSFLIACAAIAFVSTWAKTDTRTYEMAVLRFLGASRILVIAIVSTEATVVSVGGALLAVLISYGALSWLNSATGAAPPYSIGLDWCLTAPSIMIGAAIAGSAIPCAVSLEEDVRGTLERDR